MRVFQINSVCGIRSTGRICTDIAEELIRNGHDCMIAYGREQAPEKYQPFSFRMNTDWNVRKNGLKARILDNEGFNAKRETQSLVAQLRDYRPDVVHLHNLHGYYINLEILLTYLAEARIPTVCTMHDCWAVTGHCAHFTTVKCARWKTGCHDCIQKKSYPASLLQDASRENWQRKRTLLTAMKHLTIVTPSRWLAEIMGESYLREFPVRVIPNGIDVSVFQPTEGDMAEKLGLQGKRIVLGVASAWGKGKGLYDFYRLAEMLDPSFRVVLVGLTAEQKKELPGNITGITRTNSTAELAQLYTLADVFVNLTYQDNYPTVNLEARACGTPVITYRTGGSPESAGENAIVVEPGDLDGVVQAISCLDKEQSSRDVETMRYTFSRENMTNNYINLYLLMRAGGGN